MLVAVQCSYPLYLSSDLDSVLIYLSARKLDMP
jgi:hypothetical protein